ncbi:MAG: ABC transporter ATP-binding protein [Synechococcaceae cyanobacterium RL_1_2]|nr:ABC transporter ATP-binding protein [Synechococcaceae cyanobacterium RL_1_2]
MTRNHSLPRLLQYGHKYRALIWQASICSVINKVFDLAPPLLIGAAVDVVVERENSFLARYGLTDVLAQLIAIAVVSFVVWSLESVFQYGFERLWRNLAQKMQNDLRLEAYDHLQHLELAYFEQRSTGGLLSIINDDINQLERFLDVGANEILQVATTIVVISSGFVITLPTVGWMTLIPIPFIIWGSFAFQKLLTPRYADVRIKVSDLNARLSNNLGGITTIKSFTTERYELEQLAKESEAYSQSNQRAIALSAAFIPLIRMLILAGFLAIMVFGGLEVTKGNLSTGTYSVLVFMTQRLLWPLTRLGQTLDLYQRAMASVDRIMNLLDTPITIRSGDRELTPEQVKGEIQLSNISFGYSDRGTIIQDLSLTIPAGKTIAIVGSTGSGKSTLVKLLLRLYEIDQGTITLDGIDIKDITLTDLRKSIGLVSQDVFLFHGSVRENIAYGNPLLPEAEIIAAAKQAECHSFIESLPQGYDTIVGERGQRLSGGQRQRIAIARAILKNPPILILDEATSAVDNETEAAIARSLEIITRDRTTIAIAHRLSTIRHADQIYVMEQGQLSEWGNHEELVERDGIYANLWQIQTGTKKFTASIPN